MMVSATSEKTAQTIFISKVNNGSWWWGIRCVAWIAQNKQTLVTTMYYKWQIGSYNYWPYQNDNHNYTVSLGGKSDTVAFNLAQDRSNTWIDKSPVRSMTFQHDNGTGTFSGRIRFQGYKCWEGFDYSESGFSFTTITIVVPEDPDEPPAPIEEEDPGVDIINDKDPKYYIFAGDAVLYASNSEDLYIINPRLTLEVNQTDSLEFSFMPDHPLYYDLTKLSTTIEVQQGKEILFRGRILNDDVDFYGQKSVHCEGALSFLGDTLMAPYAAGTYTTAKDLFKAAIDQHYAQVPNSTPERRLKYVRCDVTTEIDMESEDYQQTSEIISSLLSDVGGYIKLEYYDTGETGISYLSSLDHESNQVIDFGQNLLDISQHIDASELYTSVVCLGARDENTGERITTGNGSAMYVEDQDAIETYGRIIRVFTYDDITSQEDLRTLAEYQLALGIQQTTTFEIKAVDMHLIAPSIEKIRRGDNVRIRSGPHSIDTYFMCSKSDLDLQNPENTVYTFGATIKALTNTTSKK